eukprot:753201-Hanusia_phi.AAC.4
MQPVGVVLPQHRDPLLHFGLAGPQTSSPTRARAVDGHRLDVGAGGLSLLRPQSLLAALALGDAEVVTLPHALPHHLRRPVS